MEMENKIGEMSRQLTELVKVQVQQAEQIKTLFNRQDEQKQLVESVHELAMSVKLLTNAQQATDKKVEQLTDDMEEIKSKPAKRWDSATGTIITVVLTALITYVLTQAGLK